MKGKPHLPLAAGPAHHDLARPVAFFDRPREGEVRDHLEHRAETEPAVATVEQLLGEFPNEFRGFHPQIGQESAKPSRNTLWNPQLRTRPAGGLAHSGPQISGWKTKSPNSDSGGSRSAMVSYKSKPIRLAKGRLA